MDEINKQNNQQNNQSSKGDKKNIIIAIAAVLVVVVIAAAMMMGKQKPQVANENNIGADESVMPILDGDMGAGGPPPDEMVPSELAPMDTLPANEPTGGNEGAGMMPGVPTAN